MTREPKMKNTSSNRQTNNSSSVKASLYHYQACPFCALTRKAIKHLEKETKKAVVEQRDIVKQPKFRKELIQGGGKPQVPCLKIEDSSGAVQWLYESREIIKYLQLNYSKLDTKIAAVA